MEIICVGFSHTTTSIDVRERLAFDQQSISDFVFSLEQSSQVEEVVIISTCNRVEIYLTAKHICFDEIIEQLVSQFSVQEAELHELAYQLVNQQVVAHLFRVAAGLDSMVLGEPQILGQVTEAYKTAVELGTLGPRLSKLFLSAIHTGKRVRTETAIGEKSLSVSSLAVSLALRHSSPIEKTKVALLGAGEMAELAIEGFRKRGVQTFSVISRTLASACKLAQRWQGEAGTMDMLGDVLQDADILVSSSSAPHTLVHPNLIRKVMERRPNRPLVILDIAVPRDVDPKVGEIPGVQLYDIDDLQEGVADSLVAREREVPKAEKILNEEYHLFMAYLATLKVVPVIKQIREHAEEIRECEMDKMFRRLPDLPPEVQEYIQLMTRSLVKKILHKPTIRLREEATGPHIDQFESVTRHLFGLDQPDGAS